MIIKPVPLKDKIRGRELNDPMFTKSDVSSAVRYLKEKLEVENIIEEFGITLEQTNEIIDKAFSDVITKKSVGGNSN